MAGETNLTLTYQSDGIATLKARCVGFAYGFNVVATESHAREHRAMYPHQRALGKFKIVCQFLNYGEYRNFMDYFRAYAKSWLNPATNAISSTPGIVAALNSGNYQETWVGVPIAGITDGDHVGNIGYESTIIFQAFNDVLDPTMFTGNDTANLSNWVLGNNQGQGKAQDDINAFAYPFSKGSEAINTPATDLYGLGNIIGTGNTGMHAAPPTQVALPEPSNGLMGRG